MCLSTVYCGNREPESIVMKNVMRIDVQDGKVILTDLMERSMTFEGQLESANLVDGYVILKKSA